MRTIFLLLGIYFCGLSFPLFAQQSPKKQAIKVTLFLSTECPVSQQYTRRLRELYGEFSDKGVQFIAYFPLSTDNKQALNEFQRDYPLPFSRQPDTQHQQVRRFRASIVPEVVVQDASGTVVYQGAIDDWFYSLGKHRPEPTRHYLHDAIASVLAGQFIAPPRTEAIGCFIE